MDPWRWSVMGSSGVSIPVRLSVLKSRGDLRVFSDMRGGRPQPHLDALHGYACFEGKAFHRLPSLVLPQEMECEGFNWAGDAQHVRLTSGSAFVPSD